MNPAFLYYLDRNFRYHEYAVGSIKSLIRNGGVSPSKIFVRTCVGDFSHDLTGQALLDSYRKLGIALVDCGNLEHALGPAISKLMAIDAALSADYGQGGVVMLDADTYLPSKVSIQDWIEKLDALPGWMCATYRDPNKPRLAYSQRLDVQIFRELSGQSALASHRRSLLMKRVFGVAESDFLAWLDAQPNWTYGGMWVVRPGAKFLRCWDDAVAWQWVMNCDETAAMILRMLNPASWLWLDGLGVNHVVNPKPLDFTADVGGFLHYAGNWYRGEHAAEITAHLASLP